MCGAKNCLMPIKFNVATVEFEGIKCDSCNGIVYSIPTELKEQLNQVGEAKKRFMECLKR